LGNEIQNIGFGKRSGFNPFQKFSSKMENAKMHLE
jgi:hypothetical protein